MLIQKPHVICHRLWTEGTGASEAGLFLLHVKTHECLTQLTIALNSVILSSL